MTAGPDSSLAELQANVDAAARDLPDDEDWLAAHAPRRRMHPVTAVLAAGVLMAGAFTGGVLVQKKHDAGSSTAAAALAGLPNFGAGGFAGFAGAGAQGVAGTTAGASGVAVIGTVVSVKGTTLTVRNLAGKLVTVTVAAGVAVHAQQTLTLAQLRSGRSITVSGKTANDGHVTATAVTAR